MKKATTIGTHPGSTNGGINAKSLTLGSKRKPAHPNEPQNWNARESDLCAPSLHYANVVSQREKSAQAQEHGCRDCQHTHNTWNAQEGLSCAVSVNESNRDLSPT